MKGTSLKYSTGLLIYLSYYFLYVIMGLTFLKKTMIILDTVNTDNRKKASKEEIPTLGLYMNLQEVSRTKFKNNCTIVSFSQHLVSLSIDFFHHSLHN